MTKVQSLEFRVRSWESEGPTTHNFFKWIFAIALTLNSQLPTLNCLWGDPGRSTANYLNVDVGAKAAALGGNQFGAEDDSFAQYYNPAFLARISQKEVGFMHNEFFSDIRQNVLNYAQPIRTGSVATTLSYLSYGQISGFSTEGSPTGELSANDWLLGVSWGRNWKDRWESLASGASLKILRKTLADSSATGIAIDLGASYEFKHEKLRGLRFAGSIQNLGPGLKFKDDSSPLPLKFVFGWAYSLWGSALTLAVDGTLNRESPFYASTGIEYKILKTFFLRLGYRGNKRAEKNLTYGVGFANPRFAVDYAFIPYGDLGDTHRISAQFRFGKNAERATLESQLYQNLAKAKSLYAQGELMDAYLQAMQIESVAPWFNENVALLAEVRKNIAEMEKSYKKAQLQAQVEAVFKRGSKFFEEGNLINARFEFQAINEIDPHYPGVREYLTRIEVQFHSFVESFYQNGLNALNQAHYQKAKEEFEKVLAIEPTHADAKSGLEKCMRLLEERKKEALEAEHAELVSNLFEEAMRAYQKENYEKALPLFKEVLRMEPEHKQALEYSGQARKFLFQQYFESGKERANKGDWEEAVKNLKLAVEMRWSSEEAEALLKDVQRRWDLQKKVVSQSLYKQGLEAFLGGNQAKAKNFWKKALESDPENEEAKKGLARMEGKNQ